MSANALFLAGVGCGFVLGIAGVIVVMLVYVHNTVAKHASDMHLN